MSNNYDELFIELDKTFFNDENMGKNNFNSDLIFLRLKKQYLKITNINNYQSIQKKLYGNRTRKQVIELELVRIKNKEFKDKNIVENVLNIEKLLKMQDNDISPIIYEKVVNLIIKLELSLDMNIGLFEELCKMYENDRKLIEGSSYKK